MCIICVDYAKQLLTASEARRNISEMVIDPQHRDEIEELLADDD